MEEEGKVRNNLKKIVFCYCVLIKKVDHYIDLNFSPNIHIRHEN